MAVVKRENWNGKYSVVARNSKGQIITWQKWKPKEYNIDVLKKLFKQSGGISFKAGVESYYTGGEMVEISDFSYKPAKPGYKYQYVVSTIFNGKRIFARSRQAPAETPKRVLRDEAVEKLYRIIAAKAGVGSDVAEGEKIFKEMRLSFKEGVVYYKPKKALV